MIGNLFVVSISSKTTLLGQREGWHINQASLDTMLAGLDHLASEQAKLSTCERFEVYAYARQPVDRLVWGQFLAKQFSLPQATLRDFISMSTGQSAVCHLLRVAAGLESRIVGEPHILGQVRNAFLRAKSLGSTGPALNALGRAAIHCGKRVRSETNINDRGTSIVSLTMDRLKRDLSTLTNKRVAMLGTGKLAVELARSLSKNGAKLLIVSQCIARAKTLAREHDAMAMDLIDFSNGLGLSTGGCHVHPDAIIACTSSKSHVLSRKAFSRRWHRPIHIYDLGVPRNVDPAIAALDTITLVQLDELCESSDQNKQGVDSAELIVLECVGRLLEWYRERAAAPRIAEAIKQARESALTGGHYDSWRLHRRIMQLKQETAA